jgi:acid stress-induced BolA-like protein IbaG/YrbA
MNRDELKHLLEGIPNLQTPHVEVQGQLPHLLATVTSGSFAGVDEADRQERVWAYLRDRAPDYAPGIDFIFTNAPDELWGENSEFFYVGGQTAPEGLPAARLALQAKRAGDDAAALRYAQQAMDADESAVKTRVAGKNPAARQRDWECLEWLVRGDHGQNERLVEPLPTDRSADACALRFQDLNRAGKTELCPYGLQQRLCGRRVGW